MCCVVGECSVSTSWKCCVGEDFPDQTAVNEKFPSFDQNLLLKSLSLSVIYIRQVIVRAKADFHVVTYEAAHVLYDSE